MKLPEIIGISGTNGAGKDTLADLRVTEQNARKISLSTILRVEAAARGFDTQRNSLSEISIEYARQFGPGHLAQVALAEFKSTRQPAETGLSVVSVRRPAEAQMIQDAGGIVFWVDADRDARYERIYKRNQGRPDDLVSPDVFKAQEDAEMNPISDDPALLNMAAVKAMADITIYNDYADEDEYKQKLKDAFQLGV